MITERCNEGPRGTDRAHLETRGHRRTALFALLAGGLCASGGACDVSAGLNTFGSPPLGDTGAPAGGALLRDASSLDFERGLEGWTAAGEAFRGGPVVGHAVLTEQALPEQELRDKLGGDYWRHLPFPIGHHGERWLSSAFRRPSAEKPLGTSAGDEPQGTLISDEIELGTGMTHVQVAVGGAADPALARVELQVRRPDRPDLLQAIGACDEAHARLPFGGPARPFDGGFVAAYVFEGQGSETLIRRVVELCAAVRGMRARFRVVDASKSAHINVDDIAVSKGAPAPRAPEVWGFADYHAHPTAHLGFGGLRGIPTLWGGPGADADLYESNVAAIRRDLPSCDDRHQGGYFAPVLINGLENRLPSSAIAAVTTRHHDHAGSAPLPGHDYRSFPDFRAGSHHQYHISQIRRAHRGGLRLLSSLALHNAALEYGVGYLVDGPNGKPRVNVTPDLLVIEGHVAAMRSLAAKNQSWMSIAYSPAEARAIIQSGKLAVVLGAEVDRLGTLFVDAGRPAKGPAEEVSYLLGLGLRQLIPIHAVDNELGGPVVFQDLYNTANDWLRRNPVFRDYKSDLPAGPGSAEFQRTRTFFTLQEVPSCKGATDRGECVSFRFASEQSRSALAQYLDFVSYPETHPFILTDKPGSTYANTSGTSVGHTNAGGLTTKGESYLQAMMDRGMLVDIAHMSDKAAARAVKLAEARAGGKYPVMISHVGFRAQGFSGDYSDAKSKLLAGAPMGESERPCIRAPEGPTCAKVKTIDANIKAVLGSSPQPGTASRGFLPSEFDVSTSLAVAVAKSGGVIGPFLGQSPIDASSVGFTADCAMSSKGFAGATLFARTRFSRYAVGMASDFGMHATVAPRFGKDACAAYVKADVSVAAQVLETRLNAGQYAFSAQDRGVRYVGRPCAGRCADNEPLVPQAIGQRSYDVNTDGLAHYGLVPDMLQDLKNLGVDLGPLFSSAEGYLRMWEQAWESAGCNQGAACNPTPAWVDPKACGEGCPDAWNQGAPLTSLGAKLGYCGMPKTVHLDNATVVFGGEYVDDQERYSVFKLGSPTIAWKCGLDKRTIACPARAGYVKVRRTFKEQVWFECLDSP
jgi:microsomal dipeptidase-like Zn-dependent dipeptidase